jgi:hypothetical protein
VDGGLQVGFCARLRRNGWNLGARSEATSSADDLIERWPEIERP